MTGGSANKSRLFLGFSGLSCFFGTLWCSRLFCFEFTSLSPRKTCVFAEFALSEPVFAMCCGQNFLSLLFAGFSRLSPPLKVFALLFFILLPSLSWWLARAFLPLPCLFVPTGCRRPIGWSGAVFSFVFVFSLCPGRLPFLFVLFLLSAFSLSFSRFLSLSLPYSLSISLSLSPICIESLPPCPKRLQMNQGIGGLVAFDEPPCF